ncbi:DoxX family protein [Flavobacterium sp. ARAG 55.4]|uniref:DoxX family protein n=1 Tax=Flavobacterium sp. ARAG 55.4 TaxID=3451357 RepID=UPI003F4536A9
MKTSVVIWVLRVVVAVILWQTLYFKFTAAPESVYIFSKLGVEPYGRIGTGILELLAAVLILVPRTSWIGALLGFGLMSGAVVSHVFVLGIEVQNDGGTLFLLALFVWISCIVLIYKDKSKWSNLLNLKF